MTIIAAGMMSLLAAPAPAPAPARAEGAADALAACLAAHTTKAEKALTIQWLFAAISAHPDLAGMSKVTAEDRTKVTAQLSQLTQDMFTRHCRAETIAGLREDGVSTLNDSLGTLLTTAAQSAMTSPAFVQSVTQMDSTLNNPAFSVLYKEAGVTPSDKANDDGHDGPRR